ncbi:hypothetical protein [Aminobacter sp. BE322]|uniref:hypothetical protein n=1 Tax=unclassified Aminobacter TaxID=2644704 RepID=UPI003D1A3459
MSAASAPASGSMSPLAVYGGEAMSVDGRVVDLTRPSADAPVRVGERCAYDSSGERVRL